ncbi:MAG: mitochondrial fission ELM1 family protein [Parvularculaceae bacterium]
MSDGKLRVWAVHDGKAGDAVQCAAVAAALAPGFETRVIAPRAPFSWAAPWGPVDPRDAPGRAGGALSGELPDIAVVSGRRAIPYAKALKRAGARIVILKDPRAAYEIADFIWAPAHDGIVGENIFVTLTSPHGLSPAMKQAKAKPAEAVAQLSWPLLGAVLGGPTKRKGSHADYSEEAARALGALITDAAKDYAAIIITPSRRTPLAFLDILSASIAHDRVIIWSGEGENPYASMLAHADTLIVPGESHNMVSEALASGAGVYIWRPQGMAPKMEWFVGELFAQGHARPLMKSAPPFARAPVDATPEIVAEIKRRFGL